MSWGPYHTGGKGWRAKGKGGDWNKGQWHGQWGRAQYNRWQDHSWNSSNEEVGPNVFDFEKAVPVTSEPTVLIQATYSYAYKSADVCDVLSPAWSVRKLRMPEPGQHIDLSLERGLAALQNEDGSFELTTELAAVLGLQDASSVLACADDPDAAAYGAILVLKTIRTFRGGQLREGWGHISSRAEQLACSSLSVEPSLLTQALDEIGASTTSSEVLPTPVLETLQANFAPPGRWSFFELWGKLLPVESMRTLHKEGGFLCPRFFLVDLASAPLSPYDVDKSYPIVRQGACIFVGQPPDELGHHDAMRQGRQLEAQLCTYSWLEEDHVLTEVLLPGARVVFSAAPDAVLGDGMEGDADEPLLPGDESGYETAGYKVDADFLVSGHSFEHCRIWRGEHPPVPPESYVEVKKTTHLKGHAGTFKMLKYWLQAALMACGTVVISTTDGSPDGDVVQETGQFSLADLQRSVQAKKIWGSLASMLRYILTETAEADGQWTLRAQKARGRAPVRLTLSRGWQGGSEEASSAVLQRLATFFEDLQ